MYTARTHLCVARQTRTQLVLEDGSRLHSAPGNGGALYCYPGNRRFPERLVYAHEAEFRKVQRMLERWHSDRTYEVRRALQGSCYILDDPSCPQEALALAEKFVADLAAIMKK